MTSFQNTFGGQNIRSADLSYRAVALTASVTLVWPLNAQDGADILAQKMDVTPSGGGFVITLPDADLTSTGDDALFTNLGAFSYSIVDADGVAVATVAAGEEWFLYVTDNSETAGGWRAVEFGATAGAADAASL